MIFISLLLAALAHGACEELAGKYAGVEKPSYGSDFSSLDIGLRDGARKAIVVLRPIGSNSERVLNLDLDGLPRPGDGEYTGDTYRAFCENETMEVFAEFSGRPAPLVFVFYRDAEELVLVNAVGGYARITGRFRPR